MAKSSKKSSKKVAHSSRKPSFKVILKVASQKRIPFGDRMLSFIEKSFLNNRTVKKLGYVWEEGRGGNFYLVPDDKS